MNSLVIAPIVERQVGEAAFYWQQRGQSAISALDDFSSLLEFDQTLQAHLDSITAAGDVGWDLAWEALERRTAYGGY